MTLQIIDRGKNKLYPDGNFWELSRKEENNCFYGVSFVSSIKFIEENLLPFYQDVELILGLSDNGNNSIGQRMKELMDKRDVDLDIDIEEGQQIITDYLVKDLPCNPNDIHFMSKKNLEQNI